MADVLSGELLVTGDIDCPPGLPNVETIEVAGLRNGSCYGR